MPASSTPRMGSQVLGMHATDAAGTEQCDPEHPAIVNHGRRFAARIHSRPPRPFREGRLPQPVARSGIRVRPGWHPREACGHRGFSSGKSDTGRILRRGIDALCCNAASTVGHEGIKHPASSLVPSVSSCSPIPASHPTAALAVPLLRRCHRCWKNSPNPLRIDGQSDAFSVVPGAAARAAGGGSLLAKRRTR